MNAPQVVVLEAIDEAGLAILRRSSNVTVLNGPGDERVESALATCEALIVRSTPITAALMDRAPSLRVIGRHGAGLDNIDLAHAHARGIEVVNTPRSNTESVAEYVIAMMLVLTKRILGASDDLRDGGLAQAGLSLPGQTVARGHVGSEISGQRLGLVGLGAIGRSVARKAHALGALVSAYDPYVDAREMDRIGVNRCDRLEELLSTSGIVSLHVPGSSAGPLLGEREMGFLRPGAVLINSARGSLIDPSALVAAVTQGRIAGAALDVFDPEPPAPDSPLLRTPGIVCTPHMAAMTHEALRRMACDVADAVISALAGSAHADSASRALA